MITDVIIRISADGSTISCEKEQFDTHRSPRVIRETKGELIAECLQPELSRLARLSEQELRDLRLDNLRVAHAPKL